jgi:hypothetical protein
VTKRWRLAAVAATAGVVVAIGAGGCGSARPPASSGASEGGFYQTGACNREGQRSACHVEIGREGQVVNCFSGEQVCVNGAWAPCGTGPGTLTAIDLDLVSTRSAGDLSPLAVTASDAGAAYGGCADNVCNPYCIGIDVDAGGLQPDGGFTNATVYGTVIDFASFPTAKKQAMATPACTVGSPPGDYRVCSYDYCCAPATTGAATGACTKWIADEASACIPAAGADFTAGVGCVDGSGITHLPVCNRGSTDATSGTLLLAGYPGNPNAAGTTNICNNPGNNSPSEGCTVDLAQRPIPAGQCMDISVQPAAAGAVPGIKCNAAANFGSGNRTTMVNPPNTTFANLPNLGSGNYTQLPETDGCNNYSFVYTQFGSCAIYGAQPPPPAEVTFTYQASCPPGERVQWNLFAYDTDVPSFSEIVFTASTAPALLGGGTGTFTTPVTIGNPSSQGPDPAVCSMNGTPAGCPKNLITLLGEASYNEVLELGVSLVPHTAIPTVNSWQINYNCVPAE